MCARADERARSTHLLRHLGSSHAGVVQSLSDPELPWPGDSSNPVLSMASEGASDELDAELGLLH
eukprot:3824531-Alexandrium_andersonii.AAC.1